MAVRAFVGFDLTRAEVQNAFGGTSWTNNSAAWGKMARPAFVAHNNAISPWSPDAYPANARDGQTYHTFTRPSSAGMAYGHSSNGGDFNSGGYTGASTTTRAAWRTAKGHQLAVSRSRVIPALSAAEYWFTMDIAFPSLGGASIASALSADSYGAIWKWGDLSLYVKSTTWISGTTHDIVFSVRNGASEVATVTVAGVATTNTHASASYLFVLIHAKLDATTGLIAVTINGNTQSASYTGQNTVATTSEAAATEIYFGPPVTDDGSTVYVGAVDNFLIDDAAFPAGRPTVRLFTTPSDVSLTGVAAYGTSATTVADALSNPTSAKQARWSSITGSAVLNTTMPSSTGMLSDILGFEIVTQRTTNRYPQANVKVRVGLDISGTETSDVGYTQAESNPFNSESGTPPTATPSIHHVAQIFEKTGGGGKYQTSDLANIDLKLTAQT